MLVQGGQRAGAVEDRSYRRTLSSVAAAAFTDTALVDESALLHSQLLRLEPAHLRVLKALSETLGESSVDAPEPTNGRCVTDLQGLMAAGFTTTAAVQGALKVLGSFGLAQRELGKDNGDGSLSISFSDDDDSVRWSITGWGLAAVHHMHELQPE